MQEKKAYKKLLVWHKADELAYQVYMATRSFPKEELFGLTSQIRRAAISIPTNIVEGTGRQGKRELKQFLNIALGSLAELEYLIGFAQKLTFLDSTRYTALEDARKKVGGLLWNFYNKI